MPYPRSHRRPAAEPGREPRPPDTLPAWLGSMSGFPPALPGIPWCLAWKRCLAKAYYLESKSYALSGSEPACAQNGAEGFGGAGDSPRYHFKPVHCFPQESVSFQRRGSDHTASSHLLLRATCPDHPVSKGTPPLPPGTLIFPPGELCLLRAHRHPSDIPYPSLVTVCLRGLGFSSVRAGGFCLLCPLLCPSP